MQPNEHANPAPAGKPADEDAFLEGFPNILKPSFAYLQACQSYPCRISELVFGSLLASYILGFVSFGASKVNPEMDFLDALALVIIYLSISVTFSYLTAGFYTTYHNSILTMPNVPIADLTNDFGIAISKAVFFGLSMIWIQSYLVWIGLLLLIVFRRQHRKVASLSAFFLERVQPPKTTSRGTNNAESIGVFTTAVAKINKRFEQRLDGWILVTDGHQISAAAVLAMGLALTFGLPQFVASKLGKNIDVLHVYALIYFVVGIFLIRATQQTLKRKSVALGDDGLPIIRKMDPAALALANELKTPQ